LDSKKLEQYKALIIKEINSVKESLNALNEQLKPVSPDSSLGRITRMDAIQNQSVSRQSLNSKKVRLYKLEVALRSVDAQTYGICTICGEDIAENRLKIVPESTVCMDCLKNS